MDCLHALLVPLRLAAVPVMLADASFYLWITAAALPVPRFGAGTWGSASRLHVLAAGATAVFLNMADAPIIPLGFTAVAILIAHTGLGLRVVAPGLTDLAAIMRFSACVPLVTVTGTATVFFDSYHTSVIPYVLTAVSVLLTDAGFDLWIVASCLAAFTAVVGIFAERSHATVAGSAA